MRRQVYIIEWDRKAAKAFQAVTEQKLKNHLLDIIENEIAVTPLIGKPLAGIFKGVRSYRAGVIRILYKIYKERLVVVVLDIAHRREIYR